MKRFPLLSLLLGLTVATVDLGAQANVALGATVTGFGAFGNTRPGSPWAPQAAPAAFSSVTDGVFLAEGTQWDIGTVWWDRQTAGVPGEEMDAFFSTRLEIDLGAVFDIGGISVQADNNDRYGLFFRNTLVDAWTPYAIVLDVAGFGMTTRSSSAAFLNQSFRYLAISGFEGDGYHSVSEVQLFSAVPEPSTWLLLASGLLVIGLVARRKRSV